jgi:hypothetical protein
MINPSQLWAIAIEGHRDLHFFSSEALALEQSQALIRLCPRLNLHILEPMELTP